MEHMTQFNPDGHQDQTNKMAPIANPETILLLRVLASPRVLPELVCRGIGRRCFRDPKLRALFSDLVVVYRRLRPTTWPQYDSDLSLVSLGARATIKTLMQGAQTADYSSEEFEAAAFTLQERRRDLHRLAKLTRSKEDHAWALHVRRLAKCDAQTLTDVLEKALGRDRFDQIVSDNIRP